MINSREQLAQMLELGLNKSVDMVVSLTQKPTDQQLISQAFALLHQNHYQQALKITDPIQILQLPRELANDLLEIRLTCYLKTNNAPQCCSIIQSKDFSNRILTPKLDLLVARAYMLNDTKPRHDHPAIIHLLRVLEKFPYAIELVDKLISVGAQVPDFIMSITNPNVKLYAQALDRSNKGDYRGAIQILQKITEQIPNCVPALVKICVCAVACNDFDIFDSTISLLPQDDLEIVDLRAARLKQQKKIKELQNLVLCALKTDEKSANAWIAFSHLLELNNDNQRAIHAVKKALILDNNSRRGFMRHGELRLAQNDVCKAQTSFAKAHLIYQGIDSFSALVHCNCCLKRWVEAEAIAAAAVQKFSPETEAGKIAITLYGLAKRDSDLKKAIEILKRSIEKKNDNIDAFDALIEIYLKDSDYDTIEALLNKYKTKNTLFYVNYKMAEVYTYKRDYTKAMEFVQQALQVEPNNDRAHELLEQLENVLRDNDEELLEEEDLLDDSL